jgi:hypothetical protein
MSGGRIFSYAGNDQWIPLRWLEFIGAVSACHATCTTVLAVPKQAPIRKRIREIAKTWMRYRDRRIHVLLRRDGWRVVRRLVRAAERSVFTLVQLDGHSNLHCCQDSGPAI